MQNEFLIQTVVVAINLILIFGWLLYSMFAKPLEFKEPSYPKEVDLLLEMDETERKIS